MGWESLRQSIVATQSNPTCVDAQVGFDAALQELDRIPTGASAKIRGLALGKVQVALFRLAQAYTIDLYAGTQSATHNA